RATTSTTRSTWSSTSTSPTSSPWPTRVCAATPSPVSRRARTARSSSSRPTRRRGCRASTRSSARSRTTPPRRSSTRSPPCAPAPATVRSRTSFCTRSTSSPPDAPHPYGLLGADERAEPIRMTTPEFTSNRDNFCYRHPDRQSFVLCQRCLRTICPACQTQGPVGVICPECMKEQRKSQSPAQRKAQRRWGGRPGGAVAMAGRSGRPLVTYALLALTSLISLLQLLPGIGNEITQRLLFAGAYLYPDLSPFPFEPWRLLTAALVHGGLIHLALNMLALWMLGQILEPMLGRGRYLALYLISALGGSVAVALIDPAAATVGASGAIFGLMAALLIVGRHVGANVTGILVILAIN